jgi:glycosyltransferase involved in cell wall biosynthesis
LEHRRGRSRESDPFPEAQHLSFFKKAVHHPVKVAILFADFGPYHIARISNLASRLRENGHELIAYRFCDKVGTYSWNTGLPEGVESERLLDRPPESLKDALAIGRNLNRSLRSRKVDCIFLPSYSPLPNTFSFIASIFSGSKLVLMSDSWKATESVGTLGRMVKKIFVRQCDAAFVAGIPQVEYTSELGMPKERIFCGYDVVDVEYFSAEARKWSAVPNSELPIPNLPNRFFLNLGRFIEKKNLFLLLEAYARFCDANPTAGIFLVLVGEGPLKEDFVERCRGLKLQTREGMADVFDPNKTERLVIFYPFQQITETPIFYSKCEAFILPSKREEWGLVINEAQACAAPVIVSAQVGCSLDLVRSGENGYVIDPDDVPALSEILGNFASDPLLKGRLGRQGLIESRNWTVDRFSASALEAATFATRR